MKYLTLLRHAEAEQPLGVQDKDRNLSTYGSQMAPRLGRRLEQRGFMPDLVVTSPANRTLETAQILCYELGFPVENLKLCDEIYRATTMHLIRVVQGFDEGASHVVMVGHNPGLSDLVAYLCRSFESIPSHMATCSLVRLSLDVEFWALASEKCATFLEYDTPENT